MVIPCAPQRVLPAYEGGTSDKRCGADTGRLIEKKALGIRRPVSASHHALPIAQGIARMEPRVL